MLTKLAECHSDVYKTLMIALVGMNALLSLIKKRQIGQFVLIFINYANSNIVAVYYCIQHAGKCLGALMCK